MEDTSVLLRIFAQVGLNNQVISLKSQQEKIVNNSKKVIISLTQENYQLKEENNKLKQTIYSQDIIINKLPKFLTKWLLRNREIKLLDKGK